MPDYQGLKSLEKEKSSSSIINKASSAIIEFINTISYRSDIINSQYYIDFFKLENHFDDIQQAYNINPNNLEQAHKFKCLSNGSIVDGFFTNDGKTIKIYRCNPNAKKFYKPLSTKKHIAYQRKHGVY